jgi:hypothetical protein
LVVFFEKTQLTPLGEGVHTSANAAIHCEVIIDFKLDTDLGFGVLRRSTIGAPNRYVHVGVRQYDDIDKSKPSLWRMPQSILAVCRCLNSHLLTTLYSIA